MIAFLERQLRILRGRVSTMILRGVIESATESGKLRMLSVSALGDADDGEEGKGLEHMETYGLTGWAPKGAEAVLLTLEGNAGHTIVIATPDRRHRLELDAEGDVALYNDAGHKVVLGRSSILVEPANGATVELGGAGGPEVVRKGDATLVDVTTDPAHIPWLQGVHTAVGELAAYVNAIVPETVTPLTGPPPTSITGKTNAGSDTVKAVS